MEVDHAEDCQLGVVLQVDPVFDSPNIVAQVEFSARAHATKDAIHACIVRCRGSMGYIDELIKMLYYIQLEE